MSDAGLRYARAIEEREDKELLEWAQKKLEQEQAGVGSSMVMESPASGAKPASTITKTVRGAGAVAKAGGKAVGETALQGVKHFAQGLYNAITTAGDDPDARVRFGSGIAESTLGLLTVASSLPMGVMAAVSEGINQAGPQGDNAIMLPAGETPGFLRTMMSVPSLLDPEFRKLIKEKPQEVLAELNKPMTYSEFWGLMAGIATPFVPGVAKAGYNRFGRPLSTEAASAAIASGIKVLDSPLMIKESVRGFRGKSLTPESMLTIDQFAERVQQMQASGSKASKTSKTPKAEPAKPPESPEGPLRSVGEIVGDYRTQLGTNIEAAIKRADAIIKEELGFQTGKPLNVGAGRPSRTPVEAASSMLEQVKAEQPQQLIKLSDGGFVDPMMLARMAIGGALGGTQGETPEERIVFAIGGMFGGAVAPAVIKRIANNIVKAVKAEAPRVLDTTNPRVPNTIPPPKQLSLFDESTSGIKVPKSGDLDAVTLLTLDGDQLMAIDVFQKAKHIETQAVQQVFDIAKAVSKGEVKPEGSIKRAIALARSVAAKVREPKNDYHARSGVAARVADAEKGLDRLVKEYGVNHTDMELANFIMKMPARESGGIVSFGVPTIPRLSKGLRLYYASSESLLQTWYSAILSGEALVKNTFGSLPLLAMAPVSRSLAALRFRNSGIGLTEGMRGYATIWEGMIEQFRLARHWEKWGEEARRMGSNHTETIPKGFEALSDLAEEAGWSGLAKALDYVNTGAGLPPEVMLRTDGSFKAVNHRLQIHWEAMEQAVKEGGSSDAMAARINQLRSDHSLLPDEAQARATRFAEDQTFTRPFENKLMQGLYEGPDDPFLNMAYRITIAPFTRTPVRGIDVTVGQSLPGLARASATYRSNLAAGGTQAAMAKGQVYAGTMAIGAAVYLGAAGLSTGSLPRDPKERKAMEDAGIPADSIWDPLSQKYRSIEFLWPLSNFITMGANLARVLPHVGEADAQRLIHAGALAIWDGIKVPDYLQSLGEFFDIVVNGRDENGWAQSVDFIMRRLRGFYPAALAQVERAIDPRSERVIIDPKIARDSLLGVMHSEWEKVLDDVSRKTPGLSGSGKYDRNMFTGEILYGPWPWNPFKGPGWQDAPWAAEIQRLRGAGLQRVDQWIGAPMVADLSLEPEPAKRPGVRLYPGELDRLEVLMTQVVRDGDGKLIDSLNALVKSQNYKMQPDTVKEDMIQARWNQFKGMAEMQLMSENPKILRDLTEVADQLNKARQTTPSFR